MLPTTPIEVEDLSVVEMPKELEPSIEGVINRALEQRPDLLAKVAILREKEATLRRTRKAFYPTLTLSANGGYSASAVGIKVDQLSSPWFSASGPAYGAKVALSWTIFDGGARRRAVELAEADLRATEAETEEARDLAISELWRAYTNAKLAMRRLEVAAALVDASQKAYDSQLQAYQVGVGTLVDLLAARRELTRAQYVQLDTKSRVLTSVAALAYANGDLGPELRRRTRK